MRFDAKSAWPARLARLALAPWLPLRRKKPSKPNKILIVRPDRRVGNQIITSSIVLALAEHLPEAELHYLAPEGRSDLVEGLPGLAVVHVLPRRPASRLGELFALLGRLRSERFDLAIDASHWHSFSLTSAILTRLSGAAWTVGHDRPGAAALLDEWVPTPAAEPWPGELETKVGLLRSIGLSGITPHTALPESPGRDAAEAWWVQACDAPRVLLWPSTRKAITEVSVEAWPGVVQGLPLPEHAFIAVGWGPGDEPKRDALLDGLTKAGHRCDALPDTTILELGHYMACADATISGDTGPLHLAGAVARRVLGVFRNDDGARWMPSGSNKQAFLLSPDGQLEELKR